MARHVLDIQNYNLAMKHFWLTFAFICTCSLTQVAFPQDTPAFTIVAWNVESNRPNQPPVSDSTVIAGQLKELMTSDATKSQIVVLSELEPKDIFRYTSAVSEGLGHDVDFVSSGSGGFEDTDSLAVIIDRTRFEIVSAIELHRWGSQRGNFAVDDAKSSDFGALRSRSPLAVKLKDLSNSRQFWIIANHLARGESDLRIDQAKMLVEWAKSINEPMISAGDHNFDFDFHTQHGNEAFEAMTKENVWQWIKPDPLVDSNWSQDRRVRDRAVDRYPDSILDFIFVANQAKTWIGESDVIVREGDFPDDDKTSDHRPIIGRFQPQ